MANYLSITEEEKREMLFSVGVSDFGEIFSDIPDGLRLKKLDLPAGKSHQEVMDIMSGLAAQNKIYDVVLRGAGAYKHYTPSVVKYLLQRGEFLTAYTPYQPEISQGVLQSIFEYQTMICSITGMDASNASVYSGATAAADAVLMCGFNGAKRVVIPDNINPATLEVIKTYIRCRSINIDVVHSKNGHIDMAALSKKLSSDSCVYVEQLNYYGLIEDCEEVGRLARAAGAKMIMNVNPIAAALLKSAGECGADFAVGDAGCLGLPLSFGGPYIGFIACTLKEVRKLNGRIVGETVDRRGGRAFVMTLQAREQHIRREKALSNICSNQAFCALAVAIYLGAMGPAGLKEVATACTSMAYYAADEMKKDGAALKYGSEFFHEFVAVHKQKADDILAALDKEGILGGLKLGEHEILWCFTEAVTKEEADRAFKIIRGVK